MPYRKTTMACIFVFTCVTLFFSYTYGPLCRTYATPPRVVTVENDTGIYQLWKSAGLKGRIVVLLSSKLNAQIGMNISNEYMELAMRHGIVRTVYQIVPDSAWPKVFAEDLERQMPTPPKASDTDVALLLEAGRINVMPLSRFWPSAEKAIIVIEPDTWSPDEQSYILRLIQSGKLATDFIVIVKGSPSDMQKFTAALHAP
jgi:hypothetical protein